MPRCLPEGLTRQDSKAAFRTPPIFSLLQHKGDIPERDMFNTYNMGVGMTMVVSQEEADTALATLKAQGCDAYAVGEIVAGEERCGTMLRRRALPCWSPAAAPICRPCSTPRRAGKIRHGEIVRGALQYRRGLRPRAGQKRTACPASPCPGRS